MFDPGWIESATHAVSSPVFTFKTSHSPKGDSSAVAARSLRPLSIMATRSWPVISFDEVESTAKEMPNVRMAAVWTALRNASLSGRAKTRGDLPILPKRANGMYPGAGRWLLLLLEEEEDDDDDDDARSLAAGAAA